jgi:hypothetical protein
MNLEEILSISGKPGLYKVVTHGKGSLIVESLSDGKRIPVSIQKQMSALKDISIYTLSGEKPLAEVFEAIHKKYATELPVSAKSSKSDLEEFFFGILSDYDEDRVYASDIKKVVQWYLALNGVGFFDASGDESSAASTDSTEPAESIEPVQPTEDADQTNSSPSDSASQETTTENSDR